MTVKDEEEKMEAQEREDRDGLWKDAIARFLPQLLRRMLPRLYKDVDWTKEPKFLSQELRDTLQRPAAEEHNSARFVDELIQLSLKGGGTQWVLLHIEVQGEGGDDISYRMTLYCCLIFSHHHQMPVALAILTAPRPEKETVGSYNAEQYGTQLSYRYNCFEVGAQDDETLLASDNPFDLIIYVAKKEPLFKGRDKEKQKFKYLRELTRLLAFRGWDDKDRRDLLILISRMINLKDKGLQQEYTNEIKSMKGENGMAAMTFIEEYFHNEGRDEGIRLGRDEGIRFGRDEGIRLGRDEANFQTARRMRDAGMPDADIHRFTNLSLEELRSL